MSEFTALRIRQGAGVLRAAPSNSCSAVLSPILVVQINDLVGPCIWNDEGER